MMFSAGTEDNESMKIKRNEKRHLFISVPSPQTNNQCRFLLYLIMSYRTIEFEAWGADVF